jgi:hypothetical protein
MTFKPTFTTRRALAIAATAALLGFQSMGASAATNNILFIGNSFTYGQGSAVQTYMPGTVTDLNGGASIGGIPALFKSFTMQANLDYTVSLETVGGSGLDLHYNTKKPQIDKAWDSVVMHTFSTLDSAKPGNPAKLIEYTQKLSDMFEAKNANVNIHLMATWSRADQTYPVTGAWYGQDIYAMGNDVKAGYDAAAAAVTTIDGVIPVGSAWNLAMMQGFADTNPYGGIDAGKVNLWASDSYHASMFGSYLEALTIFGDLTGLDPRSLGANELVAKDLGITMAQAVAMQELAYATLNPVPEPSTWMLMAAGGAMVAAWRRRSLRKEEAQAVPTAA